MEGKQITIEQLKFMRKNLEDVIKISIDVFREETGVSVTGVEVSVIDTSDLSGRKFAVGGVRVALDLGL